MQRRNFLFVGTGLGLAACFREPRHSAAEGNNPCFVQVPYRTHGFSAAQQQLIAEAMLLLQQRLDCKNVWDNAASLMTGSMVDEEYLAKLPIDRTQTDLVLRTQIGALPELDRRGAVPTLQIHAFTEESSVVGQAPRGTVVTKFFKDASYRYTLFRAEGEFHVDLNAYYMSGDRLGRRPEVWAGVIAHEMLHNLGHLHPVGVYEDSNQIVALEKAIITNGSYRAGTNVYRFGCRSYKK
jgi:hypothetical protein